MKSYMITMFIILLALMLVLFLGGFSVYLMFFYSIGLAWSITGTILICMGEVFIWRAGLFDLLWLYRNKDDL